jgi:hypothetical protein
MDADFGSDDRVVVRGGFGDFVCEVTGKFPAAVLLTGRSGRANPVFPIVIEFFTLLRLAFSTAALRVARQFCVEARRGF